MSENFPLQEVKIVELTRVIVGPCVGRILGDCGATVIHVETSKKPDILRVAFPYKDGKAGINRAGYFNKYNADKYGMTLNLGNPKGIDVMHRLIEWADVFIESNAPGVVAKHGLDYGGVKDINPDIIMLSTCQMGQEGPLAKFKGYGVQAAAMAGFHEVTGYPDSGPVGPFGSYTDMVSPQWLIAVVVAALIYRRRTGKGQYIDHSQLETGIHFLAPSVLDYTVNGRCTERIGNRENSAAPHGAYQCKGNDCWCTISVFSNDEWLAFCGVLGNPSWTEDTRFTTFQERKRHEDELDRLVENWTRERTAEEVMSLMQRAGVSAGVVATGEDLHNDPQLQHQGHFKMISHTEIGEVPFDNPPFKLSKTPCEVKMSAPCLGEHNEHICHHILDMSDEEFIELIESGALE
ncbi:MAG: CoA transferase [Thermodesulfobacteriota bacterium]|nr:CoA transferase [Thermodesulfobacteriota bacterium]